MPQTEGEIRGVFRRGLACSVAVAAEVGVGCRGSRANNSQLKLYQEVAYEGNTYRKPEVHIGDTQKDVRDKKEQAVRKELRVKKEAVDKCRQLCLHRYRYYCKDLPKRQGLPLFLAYL